MFVVARQDQGTPRVMRGGSMLPRVWLSYPAMSELRIRMEDEYRHAVVGSHSLFVAADLGLCDLTAVASPSVAAVSLRLCGADLPFW